MSSEGLRPTPRQIFELEKGLDEDKPDFRDYLRFDFVEDLNYGVDEICAAIHIVQQDKKANNGLMSSLFPVRDTLIEKRPFIC